MSATMLSARPRRANNFTAILQLGSLMLVFVLLPIYVLPSGGFQIVDVAIALLGIVMFATARGSNSPTQALFRAPGLQMLLFTAYMIFVNGVYLLVESNTAYAIAMTQNIAGLAIFVIALSVCRTLLNTGNGILVMYVTVAMAAAVPQLMNEAGGGGGRNSMSFNNPNQLAYYVALLYGLLLLLDSLRRHIPLEKPRRLIIAGARITVVVCAHYYAVSAGSRGGMAAVVMLDLAYMLLARRRYLRTVLLALVAVVVVGIVGYQAGWHTKVMSGPLARRMARIELAWELQKRIANKTPERFTTSDVAPIFGTGKDTSVREIHNGFANIAITGGIVGSLFFLWLLYRVLKPLTHARHMDKIFFLAVFGSAVLYNVTHNGFRFRLFWIFLAVFYWAATHARAHAATAAVPARRDSLPAPRKLTELRPLQVRRS